MVTNAHCRSVLSWAISLTFVGVFASAGCSSSDSGTPSTGGHPGSGGNSSASGGSTGSGGSNGSGGSSSSGGTDGSGGSSSSGGATGSGGSSSSGGATGSGGSSSSGGTTGSGGSSNGGGTAGGSATGGGGGRTGTGGGAGGGGGNCGGHAISFNSNVAGGSDAAKARVQVDFGSSGTDLPLGNENRTIEFWAYMLTSSWAANNNTTFFYGPSSSARNADGFGLDFGANMGTTGTIDPFTNAIFDNDNQSTGVSVSTPAWVHFAMTWDGTAVRAFVNGVEKSTKTSTTSQKTLMTGRSPLTIGGYPTENSYFNGYIDEFRVWTVAKSAAQITATMHSTLVGNEAGLTGYWKFDESSGTTVADSVTTAGHTAHPGTLMAASTGQNPTFIIPTTPVPITSCP